MKLVIVESPTKAKTLLELLGKKYKIEASMGHVRDLPKKELGVDVEHDFTPGYIVPPKSRKIISKLRKEAENAESIVLATDLDREGEAIAWHLFELLKSAIKTGVERVVFHEITQEAIDEAFSHPSKINQDLVDSQQARRVLDRLVGYKLSPLLWKKVGYGLSAGRVQSVAVRLIVEKERERDAFKPEEYWSIDGEFETEDSKDFRAKLVEKDGKKIDIHNEKEAKEIDKELKNDSYIIGKVEKKERVRRPNAPFKTSTLQQVASGFYGFTARRTMDVAQKLFERGYITYHRTDSLNLSPQFVKSARSYIKKEFGQKYLPQRGVMFKTKTKRAQEAHEAIRVTSINKEPKILKLSTDEKKIYALIWKQSVECQMNPAVYDQTLISVNSKRGYIFKSAGSVIKFDGWLAVGKKLGFGQEKDELVELPVVSENAGVVLTNTYMDQHFTQPSARYSEATLIKKMEELGVGRPSTYAPTITTIKSRGYVEMEGRYFVPKDVAYVVTDLLVDHFPEIIDYDFTAKMEEQLDDIAEGSVKWVPVIRDFYIPFEKNLEEKEVTLHKKDFTTLGESEEVCPECGKKLLIKLGKYGRFLSCSGFPECEYARPVDKDGVGDNGEPKTYGKCEKCGEGEMILKQGKFGKFLACNNYPKCKNTRTYLDKIGMKCPSCGEGDVIIKKAKGRTFYGCCNYPKCDYASWKNPLEKDAQEE